MNNKNRILFQKVNISELNKEYTVVDMHMHSTYSDGINKINAIAKKAKKLGIGVAITDHNEIKGAIEIEKYSGILTIPGIEATSKEGSHIIIYFYKTESLKKFFKDDIKPYMGNDQQSPLSLKAEDIIKKARKFKTLIVFPHPYAVTYTGICNAHFNEERLNIILDSVDGVEAINAENLYKWNMKSALLAFNLNKCITGGSDGHTLYHLGKVVSYAKCEKNRKAFLDAVKNKRNKVIGKQMDILRKFTANSIKLKKTLKNYPDAIEKNIQYNFTVLNKRRKSIYEKVKNINSKIRTKVANGRK